MTLEQFEQVESLFHRGKDLPPAEQCALLDAECGDDPKVRAEAEKLLANADPEETLAALRGEVGEVLRPGADETSVTAAGPAIEGYDILREIHHGGQGVVYQAVQKSTKRKVAIKVLLEGPFASKSARRRFEREIELVAQLKHPNIIGIFHSGQTSDERQYCVMDYVRGVPLDQYVRNEKLTLEDALTLFAKVCEAVNYAHQKGVIHRDLKPSNILVDSGGEPKVLDFGLAKQLVSREASLVSLTGQVVGTLPYMSPEQAEGNPDKIDIRTDVYALGVILYQMLTGHYPYPVAGQMAEVLKHIAETPPIPPSRSWKSDSGVTKRTHKRIRPGQCPIDDEVHTIVLHTLAKERERRYQSAGELAKDIGHYLADEPIEAKRDSGWYVLRKHMRRYRMPIAAAGAFVLLLGAATVALSIMYQEQSRARAAEERQHKLADERYAEIVRLADLKRLADAKAAADGLWPAYPEKIEAMERWLQTKAAPLRANLPKHEAKLAALETTAREAFSRQQTDDETKWQCDTLTGLVRNLKRFFDPDPKKGTVASVQERLEFARGIEERSMTAPEAAAMWTHAIADISQIEVYGGFQLEPQIGLLPLRRDPHSGLWEFWHIQTGSKPMENLDGQAVNTWTLAEETGLIFVLIPGGTFWMGAQNEDAEGQNYDPGAVAHESPVHQTTLDPFFMSKYEMTQAQWQRFTGANPSSYDADWSWAGEPPAMVPMNQNKPWNPVEQVSWTDCEQVLEQLALVLPTEAQWEYAARAGTNSVWWTGNEKESIGLRRAGNLADGWTRSKGGPPNWRYEDWLEDGWSVHAPVGSFSANGFGLHDTIGNVWEWCRDLYGPYKNDVQAGDGLRKVIGNGDHVLRGGSFGRTAESARSAGRNFDASKFRTSQLGVRPARDITE